MAEKMYKTLPFGYKRVDNLPLEADSLFDSYEAAAEYAATNPTAYAGRQIAVVTEEESALYIIKPDMSLFLVGGSGSEPVSPFVAEYGFTFETDAETGIVAVIIPQGSFMEDIIIVIDEPFGEDCTISVGTANDPNAYFESAYIYPQETSVPCSYEMDVNHTTTEISPLYLYIKNPGTSGKGSLKVTVG